jgi:hypothetical protein
MVKTMKKEVCLKMSWKKNFSLVLAFIMMICLFTPVGAVLAEENFFPPESMFEGETGDSGNDGTAYNLGTIFRTAVSGNITHIKVFGVKDENGFHKAFIWKNSTEEIIGGPYSIDFVGNDEWVTFELPAPIAIEKDTDYTVGVSTPTGEGNAPMYAYKSGYFSQAGDNGKNISWPVNAGVFGSVVDARPISSWGGSNYLRDIVFVPDDINSVFAAVNAAQDGTAMMAALEDAALNLKLVDYFKLIYDQKSAVAARVLADRPESGYSSRSQIQGNLDAAVSAIIQEKWQAAFNTVNNAADAAELRQAIEVPSLGLDLSAYATLSEEQKNSVVEILFQARPVAGFSDMTALTAAFIQAISDVVSASDYGPESIFVDFIDPQSLSRDNWDCNYGTAFTTAVTGFITHIRVFGLEGETGDHTAYIWENASGNIVGGPYTMNYTGSNKWVAYKLPAAIPVPEAGKMYTVMVTTGDTGYVPYIREGTAQAGNNGISLYYPAKAGVFGPKGTARPVVSWRYNYLRDVIFVPGAMNPTVVEINSAADVSGIRSIIEKYPQWLDLTAYLKLSDDNKNQVAQLVLDGKSAGYEKAENIQDIIDANAAAFIEAAKMQAVAAVNGSDDAAEIESVFQTPILEMYLSLYETLSDTQKAEVLENIISSGPYDSLAEIQEHLNQEVKSILYGQIKPRDPEFFPIGVWMQNPEPWIMQGYKSIGVNTYISLSSGSFNETLYNRLKEYDMKVIARQNRYALENMDKAEETVLAWLQEDEPDIVRFTSDWWPLVPIAPAEIQNRYVNIKKYNQTIPVYMNLSKGVAVPSWNGRGVDTNFTHMYPEYAKGSDILSFDIYCANDGHDLSYIAKGVDNLIKYSDGKQPVWAFVETTKFNQGNFARPTPEQIKAQVWMALVHGATGISYFCHQFSPNFIEWGPLDASYADIKEAIKGINEQIASLAPVLNSPSTSGYASVSSSNADVTVDLMTKEYDGARYIFAVGMNNASTTATFSIPAGLKVEVVGEDRYVDLKAGRFSDDFTPYGVHIYKVTNVPVGELDSLIRGAAADGKITDNGVLNSILVKVEKIIQYSEESNSSKNLYNALNALENEVKAQSDKMIEKGFAKQLLEFVQSLMDTVAAK